MPTIRSRLKLLDPHCRMNLSPFTLWPNPFIDALLKMPIELGLKSRPCTVESLPKSIGFAKSSRHF